MKVEELARELEVKSKALLEVIAKLGINEVTHHKNPLSDIQADMIRKNFDNFKVELPEVIMNRAFGLDKVNGKWGVAIFEYPKGNMSAIKMLKHVPNEVYNFKSAALDEFKKLVSDTETSDIFIEED